MTFDTEDAQDMDAELARYRGQASPQWRPADHREALGHTLDHLFGLKVPNPHPLAEEVIRGERSYTLMQAMRSSLTLAGLALPDSASHRQVVQAAATTAHLPSLLTNSLRGVTAIEAEDDEHLAALRAICTDNPVRDYHIASYSRAGLENVPVPGVDSDGHYHFMAPVVTAEGTQAHRVDGRILWTEQAIVNDDRGYVLAAMASWVAASLRAQMQILCTLLESNPTLTEDGRALFNTTDGNLVDTGSGGAPSETTLNTARNTLRTALTVGGQKSDARAATLLVPSELETTAYRAMYDLPEEHRLQVIATSYLSDATAWYVLAPPSQHPVIARSRLEGSDYSGVGLAGIGPAEFVDQDGKHHSYPGFAFDVSHSIGFAAVGRTGIFKNAGT